MIIHQLFHTYKDDFPLMLQKKNGVNLPFNGGDLYNLMACLIFELSDLAATLPLSYISRHTGDKTPPEHLSPFLNKFSSFVNGLGKDQPYNIPTIWFVGHFRDRQTATEFQRKIDAKNIKYFDEINEYNSLEDINQSYWENKSDAQPFIEFIHHTTMIGIDLLRTADYKEKLRALGRLEYMQYANIETVKSDFKEMENYLRKSSPYYVKNIAADISEYKKFWINFTKWKGTETAFGSWPHFLFNICGLPYPFKQRPLRINPEEVFTGWW